VIPSLSKLGINDRCFIKQFGAKFIIVMAVFFYIIASLSMFLISKNIYHRFGMKMETARRWLFVMLYVFFLDFCVMCFINFENQELIDTPGNFGINGNLMFGDQLSVVMGYFFTVFLSLMPVTMLIIAKYYHSALYLDGWYYYKQK
jgi:hypothetical protein